jgi:hypothetical protein
VRTPLCNAKQLGVLRRTDPEQDGDTLIVLRSTDEDSLYARFTPMLYINGSRMPEEDSSMPAARGAGAVVILPQICNVLCGTWYYM